MTLNEQGLQDINIILVDYLRTFILLEMEVIPCFDGVDDIYTGILQVLDRRGILSLYNYNILNDLYKKQQEKEGVENVINLNKDKYPYIDNPSKQAGNTLYSINNGKTSC
jgi:hypothetical protein